MRFYIYIYIYIGVSTTSSRSLLTALRAALLGAIRVLPRTLHVSSTVCATDIASLAVEAALLRLLRLSQRGAARRAVRSSREPRRATERPTGSPPPTTSNTSYY